MRSLRHLIADRHALRLLGALFACVLLLSLAAPGALAGDPHLVRPPAPPRNAPTPHFVTETNDKKWDDCEWASAAMLIERWTGERVDRRALRAAANVPKGGSSLKDVARGMAVMLDLHLRFSPNGGDPMTWRQLLARLADGGGAVIEGAYSRMPRWYRRWDRKFAASGPVKSAHAVYVERYEPRRGRVWLMDPLGQGDYQGEWISVSALEYYSYTSRGLVHAAATPARLPPVPLSRVTLGQPTLIGDVVAGSPTTLVIPIKHHGRKPPILASLRVSTTWEKVDPALPDGPLIVEPPPSPTSGVDSRIPPSSLALIGVGTAVSSPPVVTGGRKGVVLRASGWNLSAQVAVPTEPGRYRLTVTLRDGRGRAIGRKTALPFLSAIVSVAGPYRVSFDTPATLPMSDPGVTFGVTNTGTAPWLGTTNRIGGPLASSPHVVADWLFLDGTTKSAGRVYLDLQPGASVTVALPLTNVPTGATALRLDVAGPTGSLISEQGGRPTLIPIPQPSPLQKPT